MQQWTRPKLFLLLLCTEYYLFLSSLAAKVTKVVPKIINGKADSSSSDSSSSSEDSDAEKNAAVKVSSWSLYGTDCWSCVPSIYFA